MSTLLLDEQHDLDLLALYTQDEGLLVDAYQVEAQVWDTTAGLPGTQVLPLSGWLDLTVDGHFDTGSYGVVDLGTSAAWEPTAEIRRGRVIWKYRLESSGREYTVTRAFEAYDESKAMEDGLSMVLVFDVIDTGGMEWTDANIQLVRKLILRWQALVERYCRQRFVPTRETKLFRSYNNRVLHLPEPLFGLEALVENTIEFSRQSLRIWGATGPNRKNPKIELKHERPSIYALPFEQSVFSQYLAQEVSGIWGFVEPKTLGPPLLVKNVVITELLNSLGLSAASAGGGGSGGGSTSPIKRERTDGHEIEYAVEISSGGATKGGGLSLFTQASRDTLDMYRAPLALGSPRDWYL